MLVLSGRPCNISIAEIPFKRQDLICQSKACNELRMSRREGGHDVSPLTLGVMDKNLTVHIYH